MIKLYAQMALSSISRAKWRSFLTTLGVVIGVLSVIMIFALGEGFKRQVAGELKDLGSDIVVVRSGNIVEKDSDGNVTKINLQDVFAQSTLTEADVETVKAVADVSFVAPSAYISGSLLTDENKSPSEQPAVIGTTPQIRDVLARDVETGEFFTTPELNKNIAVLGSTLADELYGEDSVVGREITINGAEFVVRGVMERVDPSPLDLVNTDYNKAVYIPIGAAKALNGGTITIREITARLNSSDNTTNVAKTIDTALQTKKGGSRNYSVLEAKDFVGVLDQVFDVLTRFVAAVAAISLFVGGIGIMNIMLVSVSERTKEIGIRKSIGATNQQILGQFLVEAIILTMMGGVIGVLTAMATAAFMRLYTDIHPFISPRVVLLALGVTLAVGVIFGIVPALKAARKDPIESLR